MSDEESNVSKLVRLFEGEATSPSAVPAASPQMEELRGWERKLREDEERLAVGHRLLKEREERVNENDRLYQQKQSELEGEKNKIEMIIASLKKKGGISSRIENLSIKEAEIHKLLDEHKVMLEDKKRSFELEMEKRINHFEKEAEVKRMEMEVKLAKHMEIEVKLAKREQELDQIHEKLKEKEQYLESKLKT